MTVTATASGPQGAMMRAVVALREQRRVERDSERDSAHQALEAAGDRAGHGADQAEAMRQSAWLRFGMSLSGSLTSAGSSACSAASGESSEGPSPWASAAEGLDAVSRAAGLGPGGHAVAADQAFGFGAEVTRLEAVMEQDTLRAERSRFVEGEHRARREDIEDALADVRGAYRELGSSEGGA